MTLIVKEQMIKSMITVGYYFLTDEQPHASLCIYKWLSKLTIINTKLKKELDNFHNAWKTTFQDKKESDFEIPPINDNGDDEEQKLLYVAAQIIMNVLSIGDYEMGYMHLVEWSEDWPLLYIQVKEMIKKSSFKMSFTEWLMGHTFMAFDILGEKEFQSAGYSIKKI